MKDVECQGCRERDALIQQLSQELHALRDEVRQLKELIGRNASKFLPAAFGQPDQRTQTRR